MYRRVQELTRKATPARDSDMCPSCRTQALKYVPNDLPNLPSHATQLTPLSPLNKPDARTSSTPTYASKTPRKPRGPLESVVILASDGRAYAGGDGGKQRF